MSIEVERLLVTLEARIDGYNANLVKAQQVTDKHLAAMEARFQSLARGARGVTPQLNPLIAGMSGVGKQALANSLASERMVVGLSNYGRAAAPAAGASARLASELRNTTAAGSGLVPMLGTIGAYLGAAQVIEYASEWTRLTRSLEAGQQIFGVALKSSGELVKLANDARVDVDAYAKTYIRASASIRDYGYDNDVAAKATSALSMALKLGSASASEQASTILQFSQALQKGKLDGDEFRTVMENAGVVQELLADRLKVSKGEIIKMAAAGKLAVPQLIGALVDGGAKIERIFTQMPVTIDEAFTVLRNNIIQYIGHLNETTGATDGLVNVMGILAKNIDTIGNSALVVGAALLAMFSPAIISSAAALAVAVAAIAGPLGLILGAAAAAGSALALFGDDIKVTNDNTVSLLDSLKALWYWMSERETLDNLHEFTLYNNGRGQALARSWREGTKVTRGDGARTNRGMATSGDDPNRRRTEYERETASIAKRTLALMAQAATIGQTTLAQEKAKASAELLAAAQETARKNGTAVTPQQLAEIDQLATKYAQVAARVEFLNALHSQGEANKALRDELSLVGLIGFEYDKTKTRLDLINAAKKAGVSLTQEEIDRIEALSNENARLLETKKIIGEIRDQSSDALKGFISDLREGKSASEALGNSLNKIADKLIDMAVNGLVEGALGGLLGGGGGALGGGGGLLSIFGFAGGGVMVPGQGPANLPRFASGGVSRSAAIFGEAGPEAAVPLPDGRSIPVTLSLPNTPTASPASAAPQITFAPSIVLQNGTPQGVNEANKTLIPAMRKMVREEIVQTMSRDSRAINKIRRGR